MKAACAPNRLAKAAMENLPSIIRADQRNKVRDYFRGSDTGSCARKIWYTRTGAVPSSSTQPNNWYKMKKGDLFHDFIRNQVLANHAGYRVEYQEERVDAVFEFEDGTPVRILGNIDGIIRYAGKSWILEIKSTSSWGYKGAVKALKTGELEHYAFGYYKQANRYGWAWNATRTPERPIVHGVIIFIWNVNGDEDPDTGLPFRDFWYELDGDLIQEDCGFLGEVETDIREGRQSARGYTEVSYECVNMCDHCLSCWPKGQRKPVDPKVAVQLRELEARSGSDPDRGVGGGTPAPGGKPGRVLDPAPQGKGSRARNTKGAGAPEDGGQGQAVPQRAGKGAGPGDGKRGAGGRDRGAVDPKGSKPKDRPRNAGATGTKRKGG